MTCIGYHGNNFLTSQSKDRIVRTAVSHSCSHVAITWATSENEIKLAVHMMPVESWLSELPHATERWSQSTVASVKKGATPHNEDTTYSKPVFLYNLSCPPSPSPSMATNPYIVFQSVCEQDSTTVPSGDLHSLTNTYFDNRRKRFVSRRQHFVSPFLENDTPTTEQYPTCHFINYRSKQAEVAVWWDGSLALTCYPLQELIGKTTVAHPTRHLPQASPIICSCINPDGNMLALGLESGIVVVWDMRIGICCKVCACVSSPDVISCLKFLQFPPGDDNLDPGPTALNLGIGTAQGGVWVLDAAMNDTTPAKPLNARVKKQQQVYEGMFSSSGYDVQSSVMWFEISPHLPSLLTSVHADGILIVWDHIQQEAVCKLTLTENLLASSAFSDDGQRIFVTGKCMDGSSCNVISYDLSRLPSMAGYWDEPPTHSGGSEHSSQHKLRLPPGSRKLSSKAPPLLDAPERHMKNYMKRRLLDMEEDSIAWQKRWKELPNLLQ